MGWYDDAAAHVTFWTGPNDSSIVAIEPGPLEWQRLQLSDGSFARLVTTASAPSSTCGPPAS